jgi:hypothetical protein
MGDLLRGTLFRTPGAVRIALVRGRASMPFSANLYINVLGNSCNRMYI